MYVTNNPTSGNTPVFVFADKPQQEQSDSQRLGDAIKQLVQALLKGKDSDSGLEQMLRDQSGDTGGLGGGKEEALTRALEKLINEKLGEDFGKTEPGSSGQESGLSSQQGSSQSGVSDLLERLLSGLAKSSLDDMLKSDGKGSRFEQKDAGNMQEVAKFMDANPKQFPPPDSGSWGKELIEDKYLDKSETKAFKSAIEMIGGQLEAKASGQVPGGSSSQGTAPGVDSLGGDGGLGSPSAKPNGDQSMQLSELLTGLQNLTQQLESRNLEQDATDAANSIVSQMLPSSKPQA